MLETGPVSAVIARVALPGRLERIRHEHDRAAGLGVAYLAPEPASAFTALTASIVARFPEYPPYGGAHAVVIPHLALAESAVAPLDSIDVIATRSLPFSRRISAIEVLAEGPDGRWHRHWRVPLGVRP